MTENIKNEIHNGINELFASAALDKMADDMPAYYDKLKTIKEIAEILGIDTDHESGHPN